MKTIEQIKNELMVRECENLASFYKSRDFIGIVMEGYVGINQRNNDEIINQALEELIIQDKNEVIV